MFRNCVISVFLVHNFENKDNFKNNFNSVQTTIFGGILEKIEAILLPKNVFLEKKIIEKTIDSSLGSESKIFLQQFK